MPDISFALVWVGGLTVFAGAVVLLIVSAARLSNPKREIYQRQRDLSAAAADHSLVARPWRTR